MASYCLLALRLRPLGRHENEVETLRRPLRGNFTSMGKGASLLSAKDTLRIGGESNTFQNSLAYRASQLPQLPKSLLDQAYILRSSEEQSQLIQQSQKAQRPSTPSKHMHALQSWERSPALCPTITEDTFSALQNPVQLGLEKRSIIRCNNLPHRLARSHGKWKNA